MKRTNIMAMAVHWACVQIGQEWRRKQGLPNYH